MTWLETHRVCALCGLTDKTDEDGGCRYCGSDTSDPKEFVAALGEHGLRVATGPTPERKLVVYVAHPLGHGEDREANRANAAKWCAYLAEVHGVATVADWIVLSGVWSEEKRELGLACDLALIERCDELWMVGGRVSPGMKLEADHARSLGKRILDLTGFGWAAPERQHGPSLDYSITEVA